MEKCKARTAHGFALCGPTIPLLLFLEAVLQRNGAVEDKVVFCGILVIHAEIALTHELEALARLCGFEARFHLAAMRTLRESGFKSSKKSPAPGLPQ